MGPSFWRGMQHSTRRGIILGVVLAVPVIAAGALVQPRAARDGARLFGEVFERVERFNLDSLGEGELYERAARGLVASLDDPYAELFSPEQLTEFSRDRLGNAYGGLGIIFEEIAGVKRVGQIFADGPAYRAGVQVGDAIVAVDAVPVDELSVEATASRLLGPIGTRVTVDFARAGVRDPIRLPLMRSRVNQPAVPYTVVLGGDVGYLPLTRFNETAAEEVEIALDRLRHSGVRRYVLDLRGNGGGSFDEALAITDLFVGEGVPLATLRNRGEAPTTFAGRRAAILTDEPVVVLIDEATASASEIVAGALQDHDRALVVGAPSFGKGLVQGVYPLEGGWAVKFTTGRWFTPSGRSLQRERGPDGRPLAAGAGDLAAGGADLTRPMFRTDAGRPLGSNGGVDPDVVATPDSLGEAAQRFVRAIAPHSAAAYAALYDLALELRPQVRADFAIDTLWRTRLAARFSTAGVPVSATDIAGAAPFVDGLIEQRLAALAFGDTAALRRRVPHDAALRLAVTLARAGNSPQTLFDAGRVEVARRSASSSARPARRLPNPA